MEDETLQNKPCEFLDLPAELRNRVYHLSLVESHPIQAIYRGGREDESIWVKPPEQPALTFTCKKVRQETLPIFFGQNSFVFDTSTVSHQKSSIISIKAFREIVAFWVRTCKPYQHLIRSVGAMDHRDVWGPALITMGSYQTIYYYVIITLLGEGEETKVWLGGELEGQCSCSFQFRNWDYRTAHHHVPGARFIEAAANFTENELNSRMQGDKGHYSTCGCVQDTEKLKV